MNTVTYVVEEQQALWLFASIEEAMAFDRQRTCDYRYSQVREYRESDQFDPSNPDWPLELGPGQDNCKRLQRKVHRWWKARDAWWNQPY